MNNEFEVGVHYLVELKDCSRDLINSENHLREGMLGAVERSGATIIRDVFHSFSPHGVTGVIVIAESHVSIHTWPEYGYAALDIFTCSHLMNVGLIIEELQKLTGSQTVETQKVLRGLKLQKEAQHPTIANQTMVSQKPSLENSSAIKN